MRALLLIPMIAFAANAQKVQKAPACTWAPTDAWVKRQAEFFDESKHDWSNDSLRIALLDAAALYAPVVAPVQNGVVIDNNMSPVVVGTVPVFERLRQLAATRGSVWPTRSVVGATGTHAVYLIVRNDTALARTALKHMMEAGPAESPAADVATLEDEVRIFSGRKQIYGTQFRTQDGKVVLAPMEDSTHADLRREDAGLPPFKLGLCLAGAKK